MVVVVAAAATAAGDARTDDADTAATAVTRADGDRRRATRLLALFRSHARTHARTHPRTHTRPPVRPSVSRLSVCRNPSSCRYTRENCPPTRDASHTLLLSVPPPHAATTGRKGRGRGCRHARRSTRVARLINDDGDHRCAARYRVVPHVLVVARMFAAVVGSDASPPRSLSYVPRRPSFPWYSPLARVQRCMQGRRARGFPWTKRRTFSQNRSEGPLKRLR